MAAADKKITYTAAEVAELSKCTIITRLESRPRM